MGIFYIISLVILIAGFLSVKKSEKKLNFIKWLLMTIVLIYAYNIVVGMILGILNIKAYIWLLGVINIGITMIITTRVIFNHEYQKYEVTKYDIAGLLILLVIFGVMLVKDLYIHKGDVSHYAMDSAVHYRAAKHYAENLKIFINCEDRTFFNFNIMQTGAYINDGIFMKVINNITGLEYVYIYQIFESLTLFICGLALYAFFADKIKNKKQLIACISLLGLYIYGYPYNSWFYGFSYLTIGIAMATLLLSVVELLHSEDKIRKIVSIPLIIITSIGLIFSYCLFVPAIFASICIYCFLKDLSDKSVKKYLKFFGTNTLIVTGLLLLVTFAGIAYLFIPSFYIEGQTDLVSALKIGGGMYDEKYVNFLPYIPFAILYCFEIVKRIKERTLRYQDVFSVITVGYTALLYLAMLAGFVSDYYMLKTYFILWIAIFASIIDLVNNYCNEKLFRIDVILIVALYIILVFNKFELKLIAKIFACLLLGVFAVLPELVKNIDLSNFKKMPEKLRRKFEIKTIKLTPFVYVMIWTVFVCGWVWIKAGHVIGEEEKHSLPNLVGMYYSENCFYRKLVDLNNCFNNNEIEIALFARENLKDMTVENTELLTMGNYTRTWATAMLEISSDKIRYQEVIEDPRVYSVQDALANKDKKYMIKFASKDLAQMEECKAVLEQIKENDKIEVLFENENGFVAKIKDTVK